MPSSRKLTGATYDLGDERPLVDVDTALLQLHEELEGRRPRVAQALAYALWALGRRADLTTWTAVEEESGREFQIVTANEATQVMMVRAK